MKKHTKKPVKKVSRKAVRTAHKTVRLAKTPYLLPLAATFAGLSVLMALMVVYQYFFVLPQ